MTRTNKQRQRSYLLRQREQVPDRLARSDRICRSVIAHPLYTHAHIIHCYLPIGSEVDTRPLLRHALAHHKRLVVPIVVRGDPELQHSWLTSLDDEDLITGPFHTRQPRYPQPAPLGCWDIIIVPLLGFNRDCYRLGYGKGYYDRLLAQTATIPSLGLAFDAQHLPTLIVEIHDRPLSLIITESETFAAAPAPHSPNQFR